jgi:hypothetical protein
VVVVDYRLEDLEATGNLAVPALNAQRWIALTRPNLPTLDITHQIRETSFKNLDKG